MCPNPWHIEKTFDTYRHTRENSEIHNNVWCWTYNYNHRHNILRLFDVLPNFPFTTSETKRDY